MCGADSRPSRGTGSSRGLQAPASCTPSRRRKETVRVSLRLSRQTLKFSGSAGILGQAACLRDRPTLALMLERGYGLRRRQPPQFVVGFTSAHVLCHIREEKRATLAEVCSLGLGK